MVDYVKATNFFVKDSLLVGNPDKIVKGSEIDTEYNNIATAVASKANYASPNLTGLPTAPTASAGTNTSQLATTAFVKTALDIAAADIAITGGTIDNVDITGGTIKDLDEPLAVNSGGTGKNTLALNNVLLGNGTAAIKEVAPGASGNVLTSDGTTWASSASGAIGVGQTWQDVLSSRALDTLYTNNTGKPIQVSITTRYFLSNGPLTQLEIDGKIIQTVRNPVPGGNQYDTVSAIVPNGNTYRVFMTSTGSGIGTLFSWNELR
jgi:hypothetical protein